MSLMSTGLDNSSSETSGSANSPADEDLQTEEMIPATATLALEVSGMKCAGCVSAVEKRLLKQPGVAAAMVNLVTTVATVTYDPQTTDADHLAAQLTEGGFPAQRRDVTRSHAPAAKPSPLEQRGAQLALSALLIVCSSLGHLAPMLGIELPWLQNIWLHWGLATVTLVLCRDILRNGAQGLRHGNPNMNTLVGLGALSAYGASLVALLFPRLGWECFFDEPVMLLGFILLGRTLEGQARHRASQALRSLLALQPEQAQVFVDSAASSVAEVSDEAAAKALLNAAVLEIPAERLRVGERLRVLPGERIPGDGKVLAGQSTVDEAMLTGEFEPVLKRSGMAVSAGSLNLSGPLAIEVTQAGADTTLARMIDLVETAQARKAPIQTLVDQVAGYFTYGVMAISAATFLFWYFAGTHIWPDVLSQSDMMMGMHHGASGMHHGAGMSGAGMDASGMAASVTTPLLLSLKLAIAVLVVACPCSLGLATPTAMLVGSGLGAERGLLIRGGDVLEQVDRIDTIVLDKTGTLTTGNPQVSDVMLLLPPEQRPEQLTDQAALLRLAASLEAGTRHPLADAICEAASGTELLVVSDSMTQPGLGVQGCVGGQTVSLGNWAWMQQQGIEASEEPAAVGQLARQGKTVVYVAYGRDLVGLLALSDTLRSDALETVEALRERGLAVQLLTGDRRAAADAVAQQLKLAPEMVLADVKPEEKAATIAQLQAEGRCVAMVGDGINDAPALAQADVGIALRSGTEVAIETAQVVLMGDRLSDVLAAIDLSDATLQKIRQNLAWAFAYNVLAIPLAAGVLLPLSGFAFSPALAGALMAFSSVMVVTNSLLLRWSGGWAAPHADPV